MITGRVTPEREARVEIVLRGISGEITVEAVIDTGFDGNVMVPANVAHALGLTMIGRAQTLLANGALDEYDVYEGTVLWDGQPRFIEIDGAETEPLIGNVAPLRIRSAHPGSRWRNGRH